MECVKDVVLKALSKANPNVKVRQIEVFVETKEEAKELCNNPDNFSTLRALTGASLVTFSKHEEYTIYKAPQAKPHVAQRLLEVLQKELLKGVYRSAPS